MEAQTQESITGSVDSIVYHDQRSGFAVMRFHMATPKEDSVVAVGTFSSITNGESFRLTGIWSKHPQYGKQFKVSEYVVTRPTTLEGVERYLGSGMIKGIGPVMAKRIVEYFKEQALEIIDSKIHRLSEVPGISHKRVKMIQSAWEEQRAVKDVMLFLQTHGVSPRFAVKIFKQYGNDAITVVEKTPYRLAADVYGIGFRTADQIARNLGMPVDSMDRLQAGLRFVLTEAGEEGHCYLPESELIKRAATALSVENQDRLKAALAALLTDDSLKSEPGEPERGIYLASIWNAEQSIVRRMKSLLEKSVPAASEPVETWLAKYARQQSVELSDEQRRAIQQAVISRVLVLTGGPGTGKTTTLRAMVQMFEAMGKRIALASPTGRAAQRLSEVTEREAKTIHRLLEFDPAAKGFKCNENAPLDTDVVIIDESSMIDVKLAHHLLKAIAATTQLILVGDVDQLPSVGPGTVLRDLITSAAVPVVRLRQVFRQAGQSLIIQNAYRINRGELPELITPGTQTSDCYFLRADEPEQVVELIVKSAASSLPKRFGYDSLRDIQVLTPMNRGQAGTTNLNTVLQAALNPPSPGKTELGRGSHTFRVGDKVIQRVNNYKLEVFNGDMGRIEIIDLEEQTLGVRFGDRMVYYDSADVLELSHGFCVTVHKSQGSEYPAVILPVHTTHFLMLSRNLLYTALTRAKRTVVMVGTTKALSIAINNLEAVKRFTGLADQLSR